MNIFVKIMNRLSQHANTLNGNTRLFDKKTNWKQNTKKWCKIRTLYIRIQAYAIPLVQRADYTLLSSTVKTSTVTSGEIDQTQT